VLTASKKVWSMVTMMAPMTVYPMVLGKTVPSTEPSKDVSMVLSRVFLMGIAKDPTTADRMEPGMMDQLREPSKDS
jgi:uncharacterized membrane protein